MPELPEVETVRRGLAPAMEGGTLETIVLNRPNLRFEMPTDLQARLGGTSIAGLGRRAKYLTIAFDNGQMLVSHLGMSGSWRIESLNGTVKTLGVFHHQRGAAIAHDHIVMTVRHANGDRFEIIYNDPRRFGFLLAGTTEEINNNKHFANLGVEPTGNSLSALYLAEQFASKTTPLKAALLDQSIVAGLGNIYVCEALWRAQLSPRRKAKTLVTNKGQPTQRLELLTRTIGSVIAEAIEAGGSSLRDHKQTDGTLGYFQHRFAAYDRAGQPCRHEGCSGSIERIVQSGRSTFYCSTCQR